MKYNKKLIIENAWICYFQISNIKMQHDLD